MMRSNTFRFVRAFLRRQIWGVGIEHFKFFLQLL
jgi:hypothetical protein